MLQNISHKFDLVEYGTNAMVQLGYYTSREAILQEAFKLFLRNHPDQRLAMAIQLYGNKTVILEQAAEIAGFTPTDFEAILQAKGIEVLKTSADSFRQGWQEALTGQVKPITELWDGLSDE